MDLADRLKELMREKMVTAYEVCDATRLSQATLSLALNRKTTKLSLKSISALANYFNVNKDWLQNGIGEKRVIMDQVPDFVGEKEYLQLLGKIELMEQILREKDKRIEELIRLVTINEQHKNNGG